jgi:hypothetical protein
MLSSWEGNSLSTIDESNTTTSTAEQQTISFPSVTSSLDVVTLSDLLTQSSYYESSTVQNGLVNDSTVGSSSNEGTITQSMFSILETSTESSKLRLFKTLVKSLFFCQKLKED